MSHFHVEDDKKSHLHAKDAKDDQKIVIFLQCPSLVNDQTLKQINFCIFRYFLKMQQVVELFLFLLLRSH